MLLLDRLFGRTTGRHARPRALSRRQARRAARRLTEAAAALPTVVHRELDNRLAAVVQRHLEGETRRMPGAELLAALTDETQIVRVPPFLDDPYSGAPA